MLDWQASVLQGSSHLRPSSSGMTACVVLLCLAYYTGAEDLASHACVDPDTAL